MRILLNSKSARLPQGVANSSGKLGRHLMDTVGSSVEGQIPVLENLPPHNEDGASGGHMYSPWWLYKDQLRWQARFPPRLSHRIRWRPNDAGCKHGRGNGVAHPGQLRPPVQGGRAPLLRLFRLVRWTRRDDSERAFLLRDRSARRDRWGIPVLRFHWKWSEHETRQAAHMQTTFAAIIEAMGGR